jgi:glycerophosphoryl diester phosphodiesterase
MSRKIRLLGHRGLRYRRGRDENGRAAFEEALRVADGIEADVAVSREGTAYILHDISVKYVPRWFTRSENALGAALDAPSRRKVAGRRFEELADAEIAALRLRRGGQVLRLSQLFALAARAPAKTINLELKHPEAVPALLKELAHARAFNRVRDAQLIVSSFDAGTLQALRAAAPAIRRSLILLPPGTLPAPVYPWKPGHPGLYRDFSAASFRDAQVHAAAPQFFTVTPGCLARAHIRLLETEAPGAKLLVWTPKEYLPFRHAFLAAALARPDAAYATHAVITAYPQRLGGKLNPGPKLLPRPKSL